MKKYITCKRCGYGWETRSKSLLVTCVNCGYKVNTQKNINEEGDQE